MADVTLVCSATGLSPCVELMWESFLKFHEPIPFHAISQPDKPESTIPYLSKVANLHHVPDRVIGHGNSLDWLCKSVETPYVLVVDNDIEFLEPVLDDMVGAMNNYVAVCAPPMFDMGITYIYSGLLARGQPRVDPYCALLRTKELKKILEVFSWSCYGSPETEKHWDVGGMIYEACKLLGYPVLYEINVHLKVRHYGCITWGLAASPDKPIHDVAVERYGIIKERLAEIRSEAQVPSL